MILVASVELFVGLVLLYAALIGGGKHAMSPWDALAD